MYMHSDTSFYFYIYLSIDFISVPLGLALR